LWKVGTLAEGEREIWGTDGRFDTSFYPFESPSGVKTIGEIGVIVGASQKVKSGSEAFVVNQSIIDRRSETATEDIMRWEGG
jgi:hypothetical protein